MPTIHILIRGKVQGVFFRATAKDVADKLGAKGWIKNTDAGDVEAMVSGTTKQLEAFLTWSHQGPPRAQVTKVESTDVEETVFTSFQINR